MERESILIDIKKLLGLTEAYEVFDNDIMIHINSVFTILTQLGVGPEKGFSIRNGDAKWSEFMQDEAMLESVKSYMFLRVKLLFDPPASSTILESYNRMIQEFEWRLNVAVDPKTDNEKI